jgi:hypothetical protein
MTLEFSAPNLNVNGKMIEYAPMIPKLIKPDNIKSYFAFYLILFGASLMIGLVVTTIVTQSVMIGL